MTTSSKSTSPKKEVLTLHKKTATGKILLNGSQSLDGKKVPTSVSHFPDGTPVVAENRGLEGGNWEAQHNKFENAIADKGHKEIENKPLGVLTQQIRILKTNPDTDAKISGDLDNGIHYLIHKGPVIFSFRGDTSTIKDAIKLKLSGKTFDHKESLRKLGFTWDNDKKIWNRNFIGFGSFENSWPDHIQGILEGLNDGKRLPGIPDNDEIVHRCPPEGEGLTPCCGRTPFELEQGSRMTLDTSLVTCNKNDPKTPLDYAKERRSEAEGSQILDEALRNLRGDD